MTMLYSLAPVSAGLRRGAGAGFKKAGLVQGARWMSSGRPWQHGLLAGSALSLSGRGIQPGFAGNVKVQTQAKWFVVSTRSSRDAKETESESKTGVEAGAERPTSPTQEPTSTLRKILPAMPKTNLRENIYTIPNILTASRLVAAPFIGYCILHDYHALTLGLFAYAGITDALDGWIARRWNLKTVVGTIIDPMADKTLMTVLTVALAVKGALPVWLAVIILGRDVALAISAIYYRWISLPPPKTFARYWDFSLPSAEVRPTQISKYNTALQLGLMGLTTLAPVIPAVDLSTALGVMQYVVATTTIWSGASYVYSKDAVKILTPPPVEKEKVEDEKKDPR